MDRLHQTSPPAAKSADQRSNARRQPQRPARRNVMGLVQRKLGNRGYGRFLQAKLRVSHPQDQHEKEADRIADQVMRMTEPSAGQTPGDAEEQVQTQPLAAQITPLIQRQVEEEEPAQAKRLQRQAEEEETGQAKRLQRQTEEEEPAQAKRLQRQAEEEEPAQAKRLQRQAEEEEPAQAKLIQRQAEEEETTQTKPFQRQAEVEEPAQAKLIQRQEEEEEPVQAKLIQRQVEEAEPAQTKLLQRQAEEEEPAQAKLLQRQALDEEAPLQGKFMPTVYRAPQPRPASGGHGGASAPPGLASTIRTMNGGGQPLSPGSRAFYEPRLGVDLSRVRVHSDSRAAQAAQSIQAKAFTTGPNIVFGAGQYAPETAPGKHLLAHELTHVVQQTRPGPHSNPAAGNGAVQRAPEATATTTTASTSSSPGESDATEIAPGVMELKGKNDYTPEGAIAEWLEQRKQGKVRVKFGNLAGGEVDIKKSGNKYRLARPQSIPLTHPLFQQAGEGNGVFHPHLKLKGGETVSGYIGLGAKMAADPNEIGSFLQKNAGVIGLIGFDINSLPKIQNSLAGGRLELGLSGVRMTLGNVFTGSFSLTLINESVTFAGDATVDVKGLAQGKLELQRSEQGQITGKGEVNTKLPKNFSGAVTVIWDGQTITGTGQIGYQGEKLNGTVTLTVMLQQEAKQLEEAKKAPKEAGLEPGKASTNGKPQKKSKGKDKLSVFGEGDLDFSFTDWLTGNAHVIVDEKGYVTIIGQITPQKEFELFPQKDYVKKLFKLEARASYGIPVVGNIFIFANIGMDAFAKLGPAKFYKIKAEGTYSTDPRKCKSFSIQGSLNISAAAGLRLRGEAGAGLEILSHDIKAGAGLNGIAAIRGYAEATPVIGYREKPSEEGQDKKGEFFIRGDVEIAAQPFLGLSGDLFVEIDAPWWSPVPDKKWTWPLFNKEWPIGGSFGIGASMDYVFGSGKPPTLDFKKVDFSADKFLTDLYSDKAKPKSGEGKEQAGKWKEKNSKEADPPSKNPPKGNGQPGQLEKEPKAKSKVPPGKKTTKEADPNAKTVEGKTVKQYQDEAKRKGKKPEGKKELKGAGKQEQPGTTKSEDAEKSHKQKWERGVAVVEQALAYAKKEGIEKRELNQILRSIKKQKQYSFSDLYAEEKDKQWIVYGKMSRSRKVTNVKMRQKDETTNNLEKDIINRLTEHPNAYLVKLGDYANTTSGSIIASTDGDPTPSERERIQPLGKKYGCHHTGNKKLDVYIPDHQAPSALYKIAKSNKYVFDLLKKYGVRVQHRQRLYPHDPIKSSKQGGTVSTLSQKLEKLIKLRES